MISKSRRDFVKALTAAPLISSVAYANGSRGQLDLQNSKFSSGEKIPVSFRIGGRKAKLRRITSSESHDIGRFTTDIEFREEIEPLTVILTMEEHPGDSYCRLSLTLRADKQIANPISDLAILELSLNDSGQEINYLYGVTGGFAEHRDPSDPAAALQPWTRALRIGHNIEIDSDKSGRSSNSQTPLWLYASARDGYWFGPEWSGCWHLRINRDVTGAHLRVSLPTFNFTMSAGEQLELPAACFGAYQGSIEEGQNKLRATILKSFLPRYQGRAPTPKVIFQGYAGMPTYQTEDLLYKEVDRAAEIGCEVFVFDAGWNQPPDSADWFAWIGYWQPDTQRFPQGFDRFTKHVRDKGMKLGLWIEPRATTSSPAYKKNPDLYLLSTDDSIRSSAAFSNEQARLKGEAQGILSTTAIEKIKTEALLDLSREEGQALFLAQLESLVSLGAEWIWFDFNIHPRLAIWDLYEKADRKGMLEFEFYQGLYRVLDIFLERHPQVWLETCASGGRLIDLGMLRRSHSIWICDTASDHINRSLRGAANTLLPAAIIQTGLFLSTDILSKAPAQPAALGGSHRLLTGFGGALQFGQGLCFWNHADLSEATKYVREYKNHRAYLSKDYYNLLPDQPGIPSWDAWQYHDSMQDKGILLIFHTGEDTEGSKDIFPKGIRNLKKYRWSMILGSATVTSNDRGITIAMSSPGAALIQYSRA